MRYIIANKDISLMYFDSDPSYNLNRGNYDKATTFATIEQAKEMLRQLKKQSKSWKPFKVFKIEKFIKGYINKQYNPYTNASFTYGIYLKNNNSYIIVNPDSKIAYCEKNGVVPSETKRYPNGTYFDNQELANKKLRELKKRPTRFDSYKVMKILMFLNLNPELYFDTFNWEKNKGILTNNPDAFIIVNTSSKDVYCELKMNPASNLVRTFKTESAANSFLKKLKREDNFWNTFIVVDEDSATAKHAAVNQTKTISHQNQAVLLQNQNKPGRKPAPPKLTGKTYIINGKSRWFEFIGKNGEYRKEERWFEFSDLMQFNSRRSALTYIKTNLQEGVWKTTTTEHLRELRHKRSMKQNRFRAAYRKKQKDED